MASRPRPASAPVPANLRIANAASRHVGQIQSWTDVDVAPQRSSVQQTSRLPKPLRVAGMCACYSWQSFLQLEILIGITGAELYTLRVGMELTGSGQRHGS